MTVSMYSFADKNGNDQNFTTFNPIEAKEHARQWNLICYENEFEYSDSTIAWDFTESEESDDE